MITLMVHQKVFSDVLHIFPDIRTPLEHPAARRGPGSPYGALMDHPMYEGIEGQLFRTMRDQDVDHTQD